MFTVGQKVKTKQDFGSCPALGAIPLVPQGATGLVVDVDFHDMAVWPFLVVFDDGYEVAFEEDELEPA